MAPLDLDLDTFDPVRGPARELIDAEEQRLGQARGELVEDRRRRRPRYFDGRFLTAADLVREQQYTLLRQADLGQMVGPGVIHGLGVEVDPSGRQLIIQPGRGLASSGELISVRDIVRVDVEHLPIASTLDRAAEALLGRSRRGARVGHFVLTARPVEYAREPIQSYPTRVSGQRSLQDGELVEATWLSLIPLPNAGPREVEGRGRARLAREIFLGGWDPSANTDGLALAVVGISRNRILWIDPEMVRREVGADTPLGFGLRSRQRREAHARQYARHLEEALSDRVASGRGDGMGAREVFDLLPPAGPLPRACVRVDGTHLVQDFFPPEVYAEITLIPEDELPALLEEALTRAPIDLAGDDEALEAVPVSVLVPVPRAHFAARARALGAVARTPLPPASGRPLAHARPLDGLVALRLQRDPPPSTDPAPLDLKPWGDAIESATTLWFVRRPQFSTVSAIVTRDGRGESDAPSTLLNGPQRQRLETADEQGRFNRSFATAAKNVILAMGKLLEEPLFAAPAYVSALLGELAYALRRPLPKAPLPTPPSVPVSLAFEPSAEASVPGPLRLRPLQLRDIRRAERRFLAEGVAAVFDAPKFSSEGISGVRRRAVLGQSLVVPELARWIAARRLDGLLPPGTGSDPFLLPFLNDPDVERLRGLAAEIRLEQAAPPPPPPNTDWTLSPARPRVESLGEAKTHRLVWETGPLKFRPQLDKILTKGEAGALPLFTSVLLIRLIQLGWGIDIQDNGELQAFDLALAAWTSPEDFQIQGVPMLHPDAAPLRKAKSSGRDALLEEASSSALEFTALDTASTRLQQADFPAPVLKKAEARRAWRLLALASVDTIQTINKASKPSLAAFVGQANTAVAEHDIVSMRKAFAKL